MAKSLLDVVVVYHPKDGAADGEARVFVDILIETFRYQRPTSGLRQGPEASDPWERVEIQNCTSPEDIQSALNRPDKPTVYIILLSETFRADTKLLQATENIAGTLPRKDDGSRSALMYAFSNSARQNLPAKLNSRQIREISDLGEEPRLRPFNLALLAMHRARHVLGGIREELKLFLSHAKADGVFFARAIKDSLQRLPEVDCFYDADDLTSGSNWSAQLESAARHSILIALRTPAYEQRLACREEFETALLHGVPIVVVDAMSTAMHSSPTHLPFSAMPTVRIADGNTHRVVSAALREHLRLLLMESIAREKALDLSTSQIRVWPRFPCIANLMNAPREQQFWLIPQSQVFDQELQASRELLSSLNSSLKLEVLETFRP